MISFSGSLKIFLLVDCCDMRKGFNGLYGLVSSGFGEDPRSGALYVFCNRRHTRIKVLYRRSFSDARSFAASSCAANKATWLR